VDLETKNNSVEEKKEIGFVERDSTQVSVFWYFLSLKQWVARFLFVASTVIVCVRVCVRACVRVRVCVCEIRWHLRFSGN
jgi:hypothetical protein